MHVAKRLLAGGILITIGVFPCGASGCAISCFVPLRELKSLLCVDDPFRLPNDRRTSGGLLQHWVGIAQVLPSAL